jgi:hypothetical protein
LQAAHVTSYARIAMDKVFRQLEVLGISIKYSDTDSVIVALKRGQIFPLIIGQCFDQFKDELPGCVITSFYSLGPKIYQITYQKDGTFHTITKLKGFYISSQRAKQVVHETIFQTFVENFLQGKHMEAKLGQWQIKTTKNRQLKSIILQKVLKNSLYNKRVAFTGQIHSLDTLPYGYNSAMYSKYILKE